ncbi:MAG: DUF465 domain-containing protein [Pseudomonadota bacterium]
MAHTPHELADEFPEHAALVHKLKTSDAHFAKLAEEYHEVNRNIHRLETRVEAASDFHEEDLRKKRMRLKDEIAGMLSNASG